MDGARAEMAAQAQDALARSWTLLVRSYDEVRAVGLHLLRHNADRHRFFPSLFVAAQNLSGSRRKHKSSVQELAEPEKEES